jgi:hypothetical protein
MTIEFQSSSEVRTGQSSRSYYSTEELVIGKSSSENTESVVAVDRDNSGTQEWECPPWEAGTQGLMSDRRPRGLNVCVMKYRQTKHKIAIALHIL